MVVFTAWQGEVDGHGCCESHHATHTPAIGFPIARQASPSPQEGSVFVIDSHVSPSLPGPEVMQDQFFPSNAQQVCPAGQSSIMSHGVVPGLLLPHATRNPKTRIPTPMHRPMNRGQATTDRRERGEATRPAFARFLRRSVERTFSVWFHDEGGGELLL
jgi:hypothetical protein